MQPALQFSFKTLARLRTSPQVHVQSACASASGSLRPTVSAVLPLENFHVGGGGEGVVFYTVFLRRKVFRAHSWCSVCRQLLLVSGQCSLTTLQNILSSHPALDGHLDSLQVFTVMGGAVNTTAQVCVDTCFHFSRVDIQDCNCQMLWYLFAFKKLSNWGHLSGSVG